MSALNKFVGWVEKCMVVVACIALVAFMSIELIDVLLRYAFNSPLVWAHEFESRYLMVALFYLAVSWTYSERGHIWLDIVTTRLTPKQLRPLNAVSTLFGTVVFALITYYSAIRTWVAFDMNYIGDFSLPWPLWTTYILIPLGSLLLTVRLAADFVTTLLPARFRAEATSDHGVIDEGAST